MVAEKDGADKELLGKFLPDQYTKFLNCGNKQHSLAYRHLTSPMERASVMWMAPESIPKGQKVTFRVVVLKNMKELFLLTAQWTA